MRGRMGEVQERLRLLQEVAAGLPWGKLLGAGLDLKVNGGAREDIVCQGNVFSTC